MLIVTAFTLAKILKQPKCPSTNEERKKMQCVCVCVCVCVYAHIYIHVYMCTYTVEYSGMRRKEILPFATTWMDLEDIKQSEISHTQTNSAWYHLYV